MAAFAIAVDRALAEAETSLVGIVRKAANTQWQAGAWLLERRWAGQYSARAKLDVDATVTQRPPRQEMDETLAKIAAALKGGWYASKAETVQVWHEGRCGKCGRKLTVPESLTSGLGPECAGR